MEGLGPGAYADIAAWLSGGNPGHPKSVQPSALFLLSPYYPPEPDHILDASLTINEQRKHRTLVHKGNARQKLHSKQHPICTPTV